MSNLNLTYQSKFNFATKHHNKICEVILPKQIANIRLMCGKTQIQWAKKFGVAISMICLVPIGKSFPTPKQLEMIEEEQNLIKDHH